MTGRLKGVSQLIRCKRGRFGKARCAGRGVRMNGLTGRSKEDDEEQGTGERGGTAAV